MRREKGFTLIEIIIALAILTLLISGVVTLFFNLIVANKESQYHSQAYKILDSKIEELRGAPFDALINKTDTISELPQGQLLITADNNIDGVPQTNIKKVTLELSWKFKRNQNLKLETYISRTGIRR